MEWSQVGALAEELSAELSLPVADRYFFLVRIGANWQDYPFDWGAFVELAATLEDRSQDLAAGLPVVVVSLDSAEPTPSSQELSVPRPHRRIVVSPSTPVEALAEAWLADIVRQLGPSAHIADSSFLSRLGLGPDLLSEPSKSLLASGASAPPLKLSGAVREIADSLGAGDCSAAQIAEVVAERHPDVAGGQLRAALPRLRQTQPTRSWETWLDAVGREFDMDAVAKSRHRVVDGRLLLFGLALVNRALLVELERVGAWTPLLFEIDEQAVQTGNGHAVLSSLRFAHGYVSDLPGGEDRLDIQGEVVALCDVVTDPNVQPPLAVGLFGEWGSGKSFFMEKMREHIDGNSAELADVGRSIVQIRFNAWHYSDASLWASLAITIFERLADPEPISIEARRTWLQAQGDPNRVQREDLLRQLESYRAARAEKDAEVERLRAERAVLEDKRSDAEARRAKAAAHAPLTEVLRSVKGDKRVTDALAELSGALGFTPSFQDLMQLNRDLQTTGGYLLASWRQVRRKSLAAMLITVVVLLGLATVALIVHGGVAAWGSIATAVATVATVTTAVATGAKPAMATVSRAIALLQDAIDITAEVEDEFRTTRMRDELELNARIDTINREVDKADVDISGLDDKIAEVTTSADALSIERQLYDFLSDRAAGYQRHQGIIGMLHHDFQLLEARLLAQRSVGEPNPRLPKIDRIILYIDDLDRCQPAKVLEVLEAVHLLLALELFVVVVGVDPRWLQRSLWHQYRDSLSDGPWSGDGYLRSMPVEYLEKIFQIPLTLPAMNSTGFAKLIAGLAPSVVLTGAEPVPPAHPTDRYRTGGRARSEGARTPTRAPLVDIEPVAHTMNPTRVDLTSAEVRFAQRLGYLVDSPRAAKRLMNTYRLIRATQHVGMRSRFLGTDGRPGDYIALMTLLAVAATVPDRLLAALEHDTVGVHTWSDFIDRLARREGTGGHRPWPAGHPEVGGPLD